MYKMPFCGTVHISVKTSKVPLTKTVRKRLVWTRSKFENLCFQSLPHLVCERLSWTNLPVHVFVFFLAMRVRQESFCLNIKHIFYQYKDKELWYTSKAWHSLIYWNSLTKMPSPRLTFVCWHVKWRYWLPLPNYDETTRTFHSIFWIPSSNE